MTPQEHQLLDDFLGRLQAAGPVSKDPEADGLIRARLDSRPDAGYLLVQRNLLMDRALAEANQQIATLRQQLATAQPSGSSSFLGSASQPPLPEGFGRAPSQAYTPDQRRDEPQPQMPPQMQPQAQQQPAGWRDRWFGGGGAPAAPQPQAAPSAGPSFLGRAATTAAGVAGGMFLFNGIEHLIGGHNNNGMGGNGGNNGNSLFGNNNNDGGSLSGPMTENITENVYMQDDSSRNRQSFLDDDNGNNSNDNWASSDDGGDYPDGGDNLA